MSTAAGWEMADCGRCAVMGQKAFNRELTRMNAKRFVVSATRVERRYIDAPC